MMLPMPPPPLRPPPLQATNAIRNALQSSRPVLSLPHQKLTCDIQQRAMLHRSFEIPTPISCISNQSIQPNMIQHDASSRTEWYLPSSPQSTTDIVGIPQLADAASQHRACLPSVQIPSTIWSDKVPIQIPIVSLQGRDTRLRPLSSVTAMAPAPQNQQESFVGATEISLRLPAIIAVPAIDRKYLSDHQAFLRLQIEVFAATGDDVNSHTRGRNHRIVVGQVGIRCRHCSHIPPRLRQHATSYFPATMNGLYQAAQNMSTNHIQCEVCPHMPDSTKEHFKMLIPSKKKISRVGRLYWANHARQLGLVDTDSGIAFRPHGQHDTTTTTPI